jgi:hypothetical protein
MNTSIIMVQMADTKWTAAALEVACKQAQANNAEIALVKMLPANYLNWLGVEANEYRFTDSECEDIQTYHAIADKNGVAISTHVCKYDLLDEGLAEAADKVNADVVFAEIHDGSIPLTHKLHVKHLQQCLEEHHHHLFTVEQPAVTANWTPRAITVEA